jgi:hypothetical protein
VLLRFGERLPEGGGLRRSGGVHRRSGGVPRRSGGVLRRDGGVQLCSRSVERRSKTFAGSSFVAQRRTFFCAGSSFVSQRRSFLFAGSSSVSHKRSAGVEVCSKPQHLRSKISQRRSFVGSLGSAGVARNDALPLCRPGGSDFLGRGVGWGGNCQMVKGPNGQMKATGNREWGGVFLWPFGHLAL